MEINQRQRLLEEQIINMQSTLEMPKETEFFMSDLHGEYQHFKEVISSGAGGIQEKINYCFSDSLTAIEKEQLLVLIQSPEEYVTTSVIKSMIEIEKTINQLTSLILFIGQKYPKDKILSYIPEKQLPIVQTLLNDKKVTKDLLGLLYHSEIYKDLIQTLAHTIQYLTINHLHIVGDIFDRGSEPDRIIEFIRNYPSADIQWGNHDITWMGAARGSDICMMNILRISARYGHLEILENAYGIDLSALYKFATDYYQENIAFQPKLTDNDYAKEKVVLMNLAQQATAIIQFKLEHQLIERRPEFNMSHRLLFDKINFKQARIHLNGVDYPLEHTCFQTVDPSMPSKLTQAETELLKCLRKNFDHSEKLQKDIDFLIEKGSMYLIYNQNLLVHGCLPMESDGSFKKLIIQDKAYSGRQLLDFFEEQLRYCCKYPAVQEDFATDVVWYLWSGEVSSLFGKKEMTTFERYFIADKRTHTEEKNAYYALREKETVCKKILDAFDLDPKTAHIINGHTPIKEVKGETPIKGNGKLIVIDGGFASAYQKTTGISGYTLISNSYSLSLVAHRKTQPNGRERQIYIKRLIDRAPDRLLTKHTTEGAELAKKTNWLKQSIKKTWPNTSKI